MSFPFFSSHPIDVIFSIDSLIAVTIYIIQISV